MRVAGQRHLFAKGLAVHALAARDEKGVCGQKRRWRHAVQGRRRRHQHHVGFAPRNRIERRQALGDQILVRRQGVVGQRLPVRQHAHPQIGGEPLHLVAQALGVHRIGDHHDIHRVPRQRSDRQCIGRSGQRGKGNAVAGFGLRQCAHSGQQGGRGGHAGEGVEVGGRLYGRWAGDSAGYGEPRLPAGLTTAKPTAISARLPPPPALPSASPAASSRQSGIRPDRG